MKIIYYRVDKLGRRKLPAANDEAAIAKVKKINEINYEFWHDIGDGTGGENTKIIRLDKEITKTIWSE